MNDPLGLFDDSDPLGLFDEEKKKPGMLDKVVGAGEAALSTAGGMLAMIPAGIGTALTAGNELTQGRLPDSKLLEETFSGIQHKLTPGPWTEQGKEYAEDLAKSGFMQSLNALGPVAHTLPPLRTAPSPRSLVPRGARSPVDEALARSRPEEKPIEPTRPGEAAPELDLFGPDQKQIGRSPYDANGERWQVDQNGIPIKQSLSEDVQRSESPQQGQLFPIDEQAPRDRYTMARQADEQRSMFEDQQNQLRQQQEQVKQQEIEQAYLAREQQKQQLVREAEQAKREQSLYDLQDQINQDRVSRGQQRKAQARMRGPGNQRGAIDLPAVQEAIGKFKEGLADALDVLHSFKGTFNDVEMQLAEKAMRSETSQDHLVLMSPDEFHRLAAPRSEWHTKGAGAEIKRDSIREGLKKKAGLHDIPYLLYDKKGNIIAHEGRHRMDVFKEQGIDLVPIRLRGFDSRDIPAKLNAEISPLRQTSDFTSQAPSPIRLPQSQRGGISHEFIDAAAKKGIEALEKLRQVAWNKFWDSGRNYDGPEYQDVKAIDNKIFELEKRKRVADGLNTNKPKEIAPGYTQIPSGTKVMATHGLKYSEPTMGTVVGTKDMRFEDGPYRLAVVDFGDGIPRTILPGDITKVFDGPRGPSSQRGGINLDIFSNKEKTKAIEDIIGSKLYAPEVKATDVIAEALQTGKDSKGSINLSAGGTLEGMKRNSPLVKGAVRIIQRWKNISEDKIRTNVIPVEQGFRKLNTQEVIDLGKVFMKEMFEKERYSAAELAQIGLSEKQLIAYNRMRQMFDAVLEDINASRTERGLKPVSPQEAYLSSRWRGPFRRGIYNAEGNLAWYLAAESKKGLDQQTQALLKEFPDLVAGEQTNHTRLRGRTKSDASELYTTMLDILGRDDPNVAKIEQWYKDTVKADAEGAYAQAKHFIHKGNIRGFVGDRPGLRGTKSEALALFQEQINYAKNGHKWAGLTRAGHELKEIFANKELQDQQPNNMNYLREYYADQIGINTNEVITSMENWLTKNGRSVDSIRDNVNAVKQTWILQKLAASAGYGLSQVLQAANMLPHLIDLAIKNRANPLAVPAALIQGTAEGLLMATGHIIGKADTLISSAKYRPGDSVFSAKAMKYAEDNSIITRSLADESPIESSFSMTGKALGLANKTISGPEAYLRSVVYMTYVHLMKMSTKLPDLEIFRAAEERTNASMGDYRAGERAMVFSKMGSLGDMANILQTYPINFYNQYSWAGREALRRNPMPIVAMLGTHYMIAGVMGLPGLQDIDKLWNWTKNQLADNYPDAWNKVKDLDLKEGALNLLGESGLYGLASTQSGINVTSRAAAPAGSEMLVNPGAPYIDALKQLGSIGKAALDPDAQNLSQAALNVSPVGTQGALETGLLRDQTSVETPKGRVYGKTSDLADRKGQITRTPADEAIRKWSLRSQREVMERDAAYRARQKELQGEAVAKQLPGKVYNEIRKGDMDKAREYIKLYAELTGNEMTTEMFQKRALDEYTNAAEKAEMKAKTIPGLVALKQLRQLLEERNANK